MAQQTINVGASVDDHTGDIVRDAMIKCNNNFNELYATWADWTPTWTGFSANPTVIAARYIIIGKRCWCWLRTSTGTSNATTLTFTLPATAKSGTNFQQIYNIPSAVNNSGSAVSSAIMQTTPGSNVMSCFLTAAGGAWTSSGGKGISFGSITFEID